MSGFQKLLIIGCGNMGGAMLAGWLAAGEERDRFEVLDPVLDKAPRGVTLHREPPADPSHDCVVLGFKPQQLSALAPGLQSLTGPDVTVFSLLAGIEIEQLREAFPDAAAHVRVMPNLAARIGKSPLVLTEHGLSSQAREEAQTLFGMLGAAMYLEDEALFDLVTALVGSGPAFVYRFIDALAGAAQELGLDPKIADRLALAMVEGSAALAAGSDISPGQLADRVASPGGVTREGLNVLDDDKALKSLLVQTLKATADKGAELSKTARKQP